MTTVTVKGQVTIPKRIRKKLGIVPGTHIKFVEKNNAVIIQPDEIPNPFEKWVGFLDIKKNTDDIMKNMRGHHE
jgi:AbrB family looped-hinge helix DNA binding protein